MQNYKQAGACVLVLLLFLADLVAAAVFELPLFAKEILIFKAGFLSGGLTCCLFLARGAGESKDER